MDNVLQTYGEQIDNVNKLTEESAMQYSAASLTPDVINKYIANNVDRATDLKKSYMRYTAKQVPIFSRKIGHLDDSGAVIASPYKINRRNNNDFAGYIVRTKSSYITSNPVQVDLKISEDVDSDQAMEMAQKKHREVSNAIDQFKKNTNWNSLVTTTAETIGGTGEGCWIMSYVDGDEMINHVMPWEVIEVIPNKLYIRYFSQYDINLDIYSYIEVYDDTQIITYKTSGEMPQASGDPMSVQNLYGTCPVIMFKNNEERQSDFFNVESLIDQYDRTMSDIASEVEQFRLAYLVFTGFQADDIEVQKFQQTGVFQIKKEGGKAEFITKKLDIAGVLELLERIEKNIIRFAESFDSVSENYTGNLTNFAIHFKMAPMKGRAKKTANFMKAGFYRAFECLEKSFATKNILFNHYDLLFTFKFDDAKNVKEEIDMFIGAGGKLSNETLLNNLSIIDSPQNEIERIQREATYEVLPETGETNANNKTAAAIVKNTDKDEEL